MNEMQVYDEHSLVQDYVTTEVSWAPKRELTFDQWEEVGSVFQQINRSLNWWIGDWLDYGDVKFGDIAPQAVQMTGAALESLLKYKAVAARIPAAIRRADLSWTHHFYVAYIDEDQRGPLLEIAARFELSSRDFKSLAQLTTKQRADLIDQLEDVTDFGTFRLILNSVRLSAVDKDAATVNGETSDEELPFSDLEHDEEADEEAALEDVFEFWDEVLPLKAARKREAIWPGMRVVAALDNSGKPVLRWERI